VPGISPPCRRRNSLRPLPAPGRRMRPAWNCMAKGCASGTRQRWARPGRKPDAGYGHSPCRPVTSAAWRHRP